MSDASGIRQLQHMTDQQAADDTSWTVLLSPSSRYANMMLLAIGVPLTQQVCCTAAAASC
jgi:hypothetical protein